MMKEILQHPIYIIGGKHKGKVKTDKELPELPVEWKNINSPLKCMDVFAGCGGLSEGLHQSGIAEAKWAVIYPQMKVCFLLVDLIGFRLKRKQRQHKHFV